MTEALQIMIKSPSNIFARRSLDTKISYLNRFRPTGRSAVHSRIMMAPFAVNPDSGPNNGSPILSMRVFRMSWTNAAMPVPKYRVEREKQRPMATNMTTVARLENPRRLEISRSCYPICLLKMATNIRITTDAEKSTTCTPDSWVSIIYLFGHL